MNQTISRPFYVVGIGASAGGLRAIETFFNHMGNDSGAAFVIVQHLSPDFKSLMKELLERKTDMEVHRVEEGMKMVPNHLYLIPPRKNLIIKERQLHLIEQDTPPRSLPNFPINLFFESLAQDCQEKAIAIVLSGTGSDGTSGLKAISEAGGVALVQSPTTAEFDGMPQSAMATGVVDQVLPPEELAKLVYKLVKNNRQLPEVIDPLIGTLDSGKVSEILKILNASEELDFSYYKTSTLSRRIHRRCSLVGCDSLNDYIVYLQNSKEERVSLRDDLLIGVTQFFRDREAWNILEHTILPRLINSIANNQQLRIWITACATGEEAYSMAMLADHVVNKMGKTNTIKLFATDIDTVALAKASQGVYPESIYTDIPSEFLDKYFVRHHGNFHVVRRIREMLIFAPHNLAKNAGFTKMNLICCRNVLIYMQPALQQQVLRTLHFSLASKGMLFLGAAETPGDVKDEFLTLSEKWRIYQKRRDIRLPIILASTATLAPIKSPSISPQKYKLTNELDPILQSAFAAFIEEQKSTCILVNLDYQILHIVCDSLDILHFNPGKFSNDITKIFPDNFKIPLKTAFHRAKQNKEKVIYTNLLFPKKEETFNLKVTYHVGNQREESFFRVVIELSDPPKLTEKHIRLQITEDTSQRILELEYELQQAKVNLQASTEELETTNEEQQATNEELLASNEELQSTNEELHSVNEELYTVNAEYQSKIQSLTEVTNDLNNLLKSTDIGVVFLDKDLKIRKFTPAATIAINLVPNDIDRPLEHITHNLELINLSQKLHHVLASYHPLEEEVKIINTENYYLMRVHPSYHEGSKYCDGLVLTFVNIDELKSAQQQLSQTLNILEQLYDTSPVGIGLQDSELRYLRINKVLAAINGHSTEDHIGKTTREMLPQLADIIEPLQRQVIETGEAITNIEIEGKTLADPHTIRHWIASYYPVKLMAGKTGLGVTVTEITPLKQAQESLKLSEARLKYLLNSSPAVIFSCLPEGNYPTTFMSPNVKSVLGYEAQEFLDNPLFWLEHLHPDERETILEDLSTLLETGSYSHEYRLLHKDGAYHWFYAQLRLVRDEKGRPSECVGYWADISDRKVAEIRQQQLQEQLEKALSQEQQLVKVTLCAINDGVVITNAQGKIVFINPQAEKFTGYKTEEVKNKSLSEIFALVDENNEQILENPVDCLLSRNGGESRQKEEYKTDFLSLEVLVNHHDQRYAVETSVALIEDEENDKIKGVVLVIRDVSKSRTLTKELSWQANHDPLTGLVNRKYFEQKVVQAIESVRQENHHDILVYLDLDRFKIVNDTSGHLAGDNLLKQVTQMIQSHIRSIDTLARLGGDEFGLLLYQCPLEKAVNIAEQIRESIHKFRFIWQDKTFRIGVSIGLAEIDRNITDLSMIVNAADRSCSLAKEKGRNRIEIYQPNNIAIINQKNQQQWSYRIREALDQGNFRLFRQPIVPTVSPHLSTEENNHYEILLRMIDEKGKFISPGVFIPAAERYDLITEIDRWVVHKSFSLLAKKARLNQSTSSGMSSVLHSINLSGKTFNNSEFIPFLEQQFKEFSVSPTQICFEITETAAIANISQAKEFIKTLREWGCLLALDDFGSGMSSFGYLKELPVNFIKIDGHFIKDIVNDETTYTIVEAIHNIGGVMGLETIAEFVENQAIIEKLQSIGVNYLQGYGIDKPKPW